MDVARHRPVTRANAPVGLILVAATTWAAGCSIIGPTTATSFLNQIEQSPDPNVRYKAYQALASPRAYDDASQKDRAVRVILERLESGREPMATRAVICRTLGQVGDPAAREAMIRLVRDPSAEIRAEALAALGKIGRPEDATVLMQAMKLDADPNCQVAAIESLGLLKSADPRTAGYLVQSMENDDPAIRLAAVRSLRKITGKDLGVKAEAWRGYVSSRANAPEAPLPLVDRATAPASAGPASAPRR